MDQNLLYILAAVLVLGVGAQWLSWRLKQPSILALLILGIVAGPVTGLLRPDEQFGDLLFPLVSLGVALVLFEGGMTLNFRDLRGHGRAVTNLVSWGALLNWLLMALGCWWLAGFSPEIAFLFAALVVVTGPTVINPLLRTMRAKADVSQVLRWEGILIDPVGALLAVLVFQYLVSGTDSWQVFAGSIGVGLAAGFAGAFTLGFVLRRHWVPEYLVNVVTLAWVVMMFAGSDFVAHESGLLTVTVMGIWLGNMKDVGVSEILSFKESLSILIISMLFIVLGARVDPMDILATGWSGVIVLAVVLLARPIVVWASTLGGSYSWRQKALLSWVAPRGIVAAAVSSLFALRLADAGYPGATDLVAYTFLVIIATVVLQSLTARLATRWLGLAEAEPNGMLIVGANPVARAVGHALQQQGFRVKLADTSYEEIRSARMAGLETYYGDPISSHADRYLELVGIGRLFAMSRRPRWNTLACMKYRTEFGPTRVFSLRNDEDRETSEREKLADEYRVPRLFQDDVTYQKLASLLARGAEVKTINLTDEFDVAAYREKNASNLLPLFSIDGNGKLRVLNEEAQPDAATSGRLVALVWPIDDHPVEET
ncbi:cation:proton antiporter [Chromatocurvus halotolerans]|uniref:Sodium/proton antiporter (CPA1 family) n=1 Tax=Chromatocurvus halotolerans TaxID=1132028 RepID=A0A4R2KQY5_9GAMM|nr:sodium:proton antiporter [Chromatocurvus halotolerans]TCO76691.1 sodium/proton antiporter (CPA1 family) [Chromatocurvus halotolerans]